MTTAAEVWSEFATSRGFDPATVSTIADTGSTGVFRAESDLVMNDFLVEVWPVLDGEGNPTGRERKRVSPMPTRVRPSVVMSTPSTDYGVVTADIAAVIEFYRLWYGIGDGVETQARAVVLLGALAQLFVEDGGGGWVRNPAMWDAPGVIKPSILSALGGS